MLIKEKMVQVGFRLPKSLLQRVDRELAATSKEHPHLRLTRADVVRELLDQSLGERDWFREHPEDMDLTPRERKKKRRAG